MELMRFFLEGAGQTPVLYVPNHRCLAGSVLAKFHIYTTNIDQGLPQPQLLFVHFPPIYYPPPQG